MMERFVLSSDCDCFIDGDEVQKAAQLGFPKSCLQSCRKQFLQAITPGWTEDSGWVDGCQNLTSHAPTARFWSLYWCDSTFCGVAINQMGGLEQDPNVGLIINTCQNIGYHSVYDPGPPPPTYACQTEASAASACTRHRVHADGTGSAAVLQQTQPSTSASSATASSLTFVLTQAGPKATAATTSSSTPYSATPTRSGSADNGQSSTSGSGLSGGVKIAVGVCSALALVALVAMSLLCLYRKKRRTSHRSLRTHLGLAQNIPSSGSPTPLMSPANSADTHGPPLTPPLRLRDRKFLASILRRGNRSPSPPLTPLTPAYSTHHNNGGFQSSPICSPTTSKLVPRRERTPRVQGGSLGSLGSGLPPVPPQVAFGMAGGPAGTTNRGSLSSYGASSVTGHSSLRNEISASASAAQLLGTPPSSPARPPRPHDGPLEIPDLVSPASPPCASPLGPPPNRALPPPPPPLPAALVAGSTASFTAVGGRPLMPKGVAAVREPDEDDCDPRGSWGSWSGPASGEGAVGASSASSATITGSGTREH